KMPWVPRLIDQMDRRCPRVRLNLDIPKAFLPSGMVYARLTNSFPSQGHATRVLRSLGVLAAAFLGRPTSRRSPSRFEPPNPLRRMDGRLGALPWLDGRGAVRIGLSYRGSFSGIKSSAVQPVSAHLGAGPEKSRKMIFRPSKNRSCSR